MIYLKEIRPINPCGFGERKAVLYKSDDDRYGLRT